MSAQPPVETDAVVTQVHGNHTYTVRVHTGDEAVVQMSPKMQRNYVSVNVGDRVRVNLSPYDLKRGMLIYKH